MEVLYWIGGHWSEIIQTVGVGGLFLTARSLQIDARARQVANRLTLTQQHRELWSYFYSQPDLKRVLETDIDLHQNPVTLKEEHFVILAVLHFNGAFKAIAAGMYRSPDGLEPDIVDFFSLPIPRTVWERIKPLQNQDLVRFVEKTLSSP